MNLDHLTRPLRILARKRYRQIRGYDTRTVARTAMLWYLCGVHDGRLDPDELELMIRWIRA